MKTKTLILLSVIGIIFIFLGFIGYQYYMKQNIQPGVKNLAKENIGIIYCSYNEGIQDIVNIISKKLKADIIELKPAVPYPTDKEEFYKRIQLENGDLSKVVLDNKLIDLKKYKLLIFGTPVIKEQPCPVIKKFLEDNADRINNKSVATIVKYNEKENTVPTQEYFYYKLYKAKQKPNFVTMAKDKTELNYTLELWFNEMQFAREELR